jgi:hypothetical protein
MNSRKDFLAAGAAVAGALAASNDALAAITEHSNSQSSPLRRRRALAIREAAAMAHYRSDIAASASNGDEGRYADKRASFAKTLPQNELAEVRPADFARFVEIIERGDPAGFEQVPRDPTAVDRLNDPQAMYAYELVGADSHATAMPPPPPFASAAMAVEIGELYWHALTLDVPFTEFETNPLIGAAVADLNAFSSPLGGDRAQRLNTASLFRSSFEGALKGPFVSQFLLLDVPDGMTTIIQRYRVPPPGERFLAAPEEWLACQRGMASKNKVAYGDARWTATMSDLAAYVHRDFSFQPYMNAALIAMSYGPQALSPTNPYRSSKTQFGDITFGNKMFLTMIAQAALVAQKTSYYHKWLVHRRVRPEVTGGRIHYQLSGRKHYGIHPDILHSEAVSRTRSLQGNALLSIAYPEGCPTHPSYPAAHACNAGACAAMLKAFFNEDFVIPDVVVATAAGDALKPWREGALTLGGEIDKLASNIAFARHAARVHYRSDSVAGLLAGEAQGIALLSDYSRTFNERFDGFVLTTFEGKRLRIRNGAVTGA